MIDFNFYNQITLNDMVTKHDINTIVNVLKEAAKDFEKLATLNDDVTCLYNAHRYNRIAKNFESSTLSFADKKKEDSNE